MQITKYHEGAIIRALRMGVNSMNTMVNVIPIDQPELLQKGFELLDNNKFELLVIGSVIKRMGGK